MCSGEFGAQDTPNIHDPNQPTVEEWELYSLQTDPVERTNLVDFATGRLRDDVSVPGMSRAALNATYRELRNDLVRQEALYAPQRVTLR
ncbi:MAG: hypothetical protein H6Q28_587 [Bacteroidetes bacterium]|nr:hypothetical protein [Bacteroidota bacterium]